LSADATQQTRDACRDVGFSAYLTKPVDTQLLLRTLDELTGGSSEALATSPPPRTPGPDPSPAAPQIVAIDPARLASLAELDQGDGFLDSLLDDFIADLDAILGQLD